jgi:protein required for attachment to host cells
MSKLKIRQGDWIIVCDGSKALLLENVGDDKFPNLQTKEVYEQEESGGRDHAADEPGRVHQSVGNARNAVETDSHDQSERRFLKSLIDRMDAAAIAGKFKSLVVVAPPKALGMMRQAYTNHVRQALRGEIDKDFVRMPVHEIEKHLIAAQA